MNIIDTAKSFGCHDLVLLDNKPTPRHLDYLDLLNVSESGDLKVDAIAEFQARPLLYIVSGDQGVDIDNKIIDLQWLLANRGERAYVGVLSPGELNVYPVNLDRNVLAKGNKKTIKQEVKESHIFFQSIVNGTFIMEGQPDAPDYVFKTIHDLMTRSSKSLIGYGINHLDVLSFLGRTLFFRFLYDRKIVRDSELQSVSSKAQSPGDCFRDVESAVATYRWLDETFNGDLLPLSSDYTSAFTKADQQTKGKLFLHLQAIMEGWEHVGNETFQLTIDWGDLDFAHIPIGVLSQVYEDFSRVWDKRQAEESSVYYTPKNIARYLVDDAFEGIADKKNARILDPSCGAGIFLVLAFRKLVAAHWEHDGKRPDTKTIQSILYNQICGFDVSESALRLAALSLYITAIELNGTPWPPKSLKFPEPLQGKGLYNHRRPEEQDDKGFILGSLRADLSEDFNGSFDMVIGNPPWSRLKGESKEEKKNVQLLNTAFTKLTRQVLSGRGLEDISKKYINPDNNPDLPFLWKATKWTKPGGIIAMALPGRIFLKQSGPGTRTFNAILQGVEITGILNGSNLSDSAVWPGMNQPFMLFFARNRVPDGSHHFHFVTPHFERLLNDKGHLRIDYQSAQPISVSEVLEDSNLLKTLAVGTSLDVEIIRKINALEWPTVNSYWESSELYTSKGYDLSAKQRQEDASYLRDLPNFSPPKNSDFFVDVSLLPKFKETTAQINPEKPTAHRPRDPALYKPPMLIVSQSPSNSLISPKSWMVRAPIAFRKKYYGYSAHGSNEANWILALLYLITHSMLFRYHTLITSSIMGAERRAMTKSDLDNFPFPVIERLPKQHHQRVAELSRQLETSASKPWQEINDFIFDLYGLDAYDRQVIKDTLEVAPPYKEFRDRANAWPVKTERHTFYDELQRLLAPSFDITHETLSIDDVDKVEKDAHSPWYFFTVASPPTASIMPKKVLNKLISQITMEANKTGCSRAVVHEEGLLLIGIIGQYRYWTLSRARLCAMDILRNHLDAFPIGRN